LACAGKKLGGGDRACQEAMMLTVVKRVVFLLITSAPIFAHAASEQVGVELNGVENQDNRCRLTFVIHNTLARPIESLKLDLVVFNTENIVSRRLVTEMAPVRADKTVVKTFAIDGACSDVGSILVNDVTACAPNEAAACLDMLDLTSRVKNVRLYK
jgi:hypothetical protein